MNKIKFDSNLMKIMSTFEMLTGAGLKDCFIDDNSTLMFIVQPNDIGKAIGKNGANIRRLSSAFNRKIKVVAFSLELEQFIKNLVHPLELREIQYEENRVILVAADTKTRGFLIGRNAQNLRNYEATIKRHFEIGELRVA